MADRGSTAQARRYPVIASGLPEPPRPLSFVCVAFSGEFQHNLDRSACVHDPRHELIVVDNREDIFFVTLGQALNDGIDRARHDLVVLVHEDVVLPDGWDRQLLVSLGELERHDPDWAVAGVAGWDASGIRGHYSAPRSYQDNLAGDAFVPVSRLDEIIVVLRKSKPLRPDPDLPSIHNIGRDLVATAEAAGGRGYVLEAPVVHKYADAQGRVIQQATGSPKIVNRRTPPYIHLKECSDEYLDHKWADHDWMDRRSGRDGERRERAATPSLTGEHGALLRAPLILLGSDGDAARLLELMARDVGIFTGSELSPEGDTLEMVPSVYRGVFRKHKCPSDWQRSLVVPDLQASAASMLDGAGWPERWGFNVPEGLLVLPELAAAFPDASYVFLHRDPLTTVLAGTSQVARLDNEMGRAAVPLAYDAAGMRRSLILEEGVAVRMARTTAYHIELVLAFRESIPAERWLDLSYERTLEAPPDVLADVAGFSGGRVVSRQVVSAVDAREAQAEQDARWASAVADVRPILEGTRRALGYD
jgi:hypothetical protein